MTFHYGVTGSGRKALVQAISEILALDAVYQGAPTFAYTIGNCTVGKNGTLTFSGEASGETSALLVAALRERGYEADVEDDTDDIHSGIPFQFAVEMPRENFTAGALENLKKIILSKETLLKKALGADNLPVEITDETLRFPWFTLHGIDGEADAYAKLVFALCDVAKKRKRVTAREREVENDKFVMRLFLVHLGMKGPEYKAARKILLKDLTGNSSWKYGPPKKAAANEAGEDMEDAHDEE